LPFYAMAGVGEVWVIDRDSKQPEVYELVAGEFRQRRADVDGWIRSNATGIELRGIGDELEIRVSGRDDTRALLP
jgi:Uma2 family endonuclease